MTSKLTLADVRKEMVRQSCSSFRKLPAFGKTDYKNDDMVRFEWPSPADLTNMPTDKPIKVVSIHYHKSPTHPKHFDAIQLKFSNGRTSAIISAVDGGHGDLEELVLDPTLSKITGTNSGDWVSQVVFYGAPHLPPKEINFHGYRLGAEQLVGNGEQLIGFYGEYS